MALGLTVEARIVAEIVATLGSITSANDEYNTDVVRVYEMYGNVLELPERPCVVLVPLPSPRNHDCPNGLERVELTLSLTCVMDVEPGGPYGSEAPWHEPIRLFANDVEKALLQDITRGQLAIDTIIRAVDIFEAPQGGPLAAAEVSVTVPFRHLTTNPTQAQ